MQNRGTQKLVTKNIRRILEKQNKAAVELAADLEMSESFLYAFLNGRKGVTLETLVRIADGLKVKVRDLFAE